jgi:RNA polymerase-binding transcription factor DksA
MADEADIAFAYINRAIESALGQRQQNTEVKVGAPFCKICDEEIPPARRDLGFHLCIQCAEDNERRKAQFVDY